MAKETIFLPDLVVWGAFLTQMLRREIRASKLNSEAHTTSMENIKGWRGNSKITAAETVCVTKCYFTLDLLSGLKEGNQLLSAVNFRLTQVCDANYRQGCTLSHR